MAREDPSQRAPHFSERHGLFVIIALGETLIIAGAGLTEASWTNNQIFVAILAVGISCAFWWSYFPRAMPALEHALAIGLFLFVGGMALATWRATRRLMVPRVLVILITAVAVVAVAGVAPAVTLGIAFLGVVTVAATEQWGILV